MNPIKDRMRLALKQAQKNRPAERINQAWLSRQVGVSTAAINKWFSGGTLGLDGENLIKASHALGVTPDWLASGSGPMKSATNLQKEDLPKLSSLSERIAYLLELRGLSQSDLAVMVGIRQPSVASWLNGRTKKLEGENLLNTAAAFSVYPEWIATGKGPICESTKNEDIESFSLTEQPIKDIGLRMRSIREELNLSQQELADLSKVSQSTIGNVEAGIREQPRRLNAIAAALGVNPEWLETGDGPIKGSNIPINSPTPSINDFLVLLSTKLTSTDASTRKLIGDMLRHYSENPDPQSRIASAIKTLLDDSHTL